MGLQLLHNLRPKLEEPALRRQLEGKLPKTRWNFKSGGKKGRWCV